MSAQDRAIQKLARELAGMKREVHSWRGPQADYTSIENGGNFTFKDGDGNVTAVVGGQDDGSNTIRHVDGPTPPVPSGLSAHVDGPIVQVSWDGTFESDVTHDWHYLEVLAVGPNNEQLTGTINDLNGGETSLAATAQGDWFITARSVSRSGKRSLDGDAGTASVQLVGLTGAIEAIQESANGKNTIYYSPTEPVAPEGGFNNGDLWFDTSEEGNNTASVWDGNGWVSMEDARLATIIAAQEALESDLQDVQTSVDGKNTITYDPALPPASYVGAVGDTWYRTSGNSMIGFWKWDGAAWIQQELSTTVIPQLDIGAGTFGTMSGSRLDAATVSTDKILIGQGGNLIAWDQVTSGITTEPHYKWLNSSNLALSLAPADSVRKVPPHMLVERFNTSNENYVLMLLGSAGRKAPGVSGASYTFSVRMYSDTPGIKASLQLATYSSDGTSTAGYIAHIAYGPVVELSSVPQDLVISGTAPEGTQFLVPLVRASGPGVVGVVSPSLRSQVGATLIENGAITTDKLAVGAITAESGVIESLDLGTATVGELDGIRIMGHSIRGEQLSGDAIDGKVITGATVQSAASGARAVMSASGFEAFDATEARTFFADATTGDVNMTGSFYSNYEGLPRVEIDNDDWASIGVPDENGVTHYTNGSGIRIGSSASAGFSVFHGSYNTPGGGIEGQAGVIEGPLGKTYLALLGNGDAALSSTHAGGVKAGTFYAFASGNTSASSWRTDGTQAARVSTFTNGDIQVSSERSNGTTAAGFVSNTAGSAYLTSNTTAGATAAVVRTYSSGNVAIQSTGNTVVTVDYPNGGRFQVPAVWGVTASSDGDVNVNAQGTLYRVSSSMRYKQDVEAAETLPSVLDVVPRTWHDKTEMETRVRIDEYRAAHGEGPLPIELQGYSDEPRRHYGAVAEEVHALGLPELVQYDAYGRPDSLSYDKFGVALIPVVRELRDRIAVLEAKLEAK